MPGKRSYTGGPMVPYYPGTPDQEQVKYLRLICSRYLRGDANATELRLACESVTTILSQPAPELPR